VATLRLDDRGVGGSTGNSDAATAEDTAADTRAALTFLRSRRDIDAPPARPRGAQLRRRDRAHGGGG
jgi:alpha/beta superfamily hydrolase